MKVIFVGMNNKVGKSPLDPTTRTGKVITRIIADLYLEGYSFLRTNLYDLDFFPKSGPLEMDVRTVTMWADRADYQKGDIVVTLGTCVNEVFRRAKFPSIKVGHPAAVWSTEKKLEYILRVIKLINEQSKEPVAP